MWRIVFINPPDWLLEVYIGIIIVLIFFYLGLVVGPDPEPLTVFTYEELRR